ncbi:uncharacterized protein Dvar_63260 [Desulfosarcina variabilis str. Montpellier]
MPFTPPIDFVSRSTQQDDGPASKPGQAQGPAPTTPSIVYFFIISNCYNFPNFLAYFYYHVSRHELL